MAALLGLAVGGALWLLRVRHRFKDPTEESIIFRIAGVQQIRDHVLRKVCDRMQETNFLKRVHRLEVEKRNTWSSESVQEAKHLLRALLQLQHIVDCSCCVDDAEGRRTRKATTYLLEHLCTRLEILLPRASERRASDSGQARGVDDFRERQEKQERAQTEREEAKAQALLDMNKKVSAEGRKDLRRCLKDLGMQVRAGKEGLRRAFKSAKVKYHPDRCKAHGKSVYEEVLSEETFKLIYNLAELEQVAR